MRRQGNQLAAGLLVEPGVCRMRDVLFHHRGIDGDPGQAAIIDRAGLAPGDRPGHSIVLVSNHSTPSSPIRLRHRTSGDGLIGGSIGGQC